MLEKLIQNPGVLKIAEALKTCNGRARLVGGCVRDSIIGRNITDIDFATDLLPSEVQNALRNSGIKSIPTGIKHGTITAVVDGVGYEITTLRRDVKCDGRHADVAFTDSWKEDASRRDFTFNALYCDIDGKIYDYFSGVKDLESRTITFIGDAEKRVLEDFLRILRVFRFHASICSSSTLSEEITNICKKHSDSLGTLSKERIKGEFFKLLSCTNCVKTLDTMRECEVLDKVIPYQLSTKFLESPHITCRPPIVKLSTALKPLICHTDVKEVVQNVTNLLRLSNKERNLLRTLLETHLPFPLSRTHRTQYLNIFGNEVFTYLAIVNYLNENSVMTEEDFVEHIRVAESFVPSTFPISGADLIVLGYKEGKHLGDTLAKLRNIWEKDPANVTKEHLLSLVPPQKETKT
ncbi:CCA tRNA nucleotidyltransferase [Anaplasma bovis]|uniref:CCA tRNA nucleotidyltransferase n=1 Tax=Anaplasma bovis TaxID=186733 RepID=UPI002FEE90FF